MKRTSCPHQRKNIKKQDIALDLVEEKDILFVTVMFSNLSEDYDFPSNARIFLEVYNRLSIDHIDLGTVDSLPEKPIKKTVVFF